MLNDMHFRLVNVESCFFLQAGWPSTFLLVYDAVWQLQRDIVAPIMHATTGNPPNCDMLALLIDPAEGAAGFTPHRDRQPKDVPNSFRPDGSPKYVAHSFFFLRCYSFSFFLFLL